MLVYEITGYQGCDRAAWSTQQEPMWLSKDEQIIGQPWDFQEKFDTTIFFSTRGTSSDDAPAVAAVCDV